MTSGVFTSHIHVVIWTLNKIMKSHQYTIRFLNFNAILNLKINEFYLLMLGMLWPWITLNWGPPSKELIPGISHSISSGPFRRGFTAVHRDMNKFKTWLPVLYYIIIWQQKIIQPAFIYWIQEQNTYSSLVSPLVSLTGEEVSWLNPRLSCPLLGPQSSGSTLGVETLLRDLSLYPWFNCPEGMAVG